MGSHRRHQFQRHQEMTIYGVHVPNHLEYSFSSLRDDEIKSIVQRFGETTGREISINPD